MESGLFARRNEAIDMLRGLTMLLMVFVNDLWTISGVPHFLEHFDVSEDGMGVSDIVFPMFLFAMGMSVPYAIERRFSKGYSGESTLGHILLRTLALLLMGVFIVNSEGAMTSTIGYGVNAYKILMVLSFFLLWNAYPAGMKYRRLLQVAGAAILIFLAVTFRTPEGGFLRSRWWGILGLIGWAYCFCGVMYMLARKRPSSVFLVWLALIVVNMLLTATRGGSRIVAGPSFIGDMADALHVGNGSSAIMAVGGMLVSLAEKTLSSRKGTVLAACSGVVAVLLVVSAAVSHRWWIICKPIGTLPWCLYVSAISLAVYTILRILESYGRTSWFNPIKSSGTATLTVYMMPYLLYSFSGIIGIQTPDCLDGIQGLLKCVFFSLLCVFLTGLLAKVGVRLKI